MFLGSRLAARNRDWLYFSPVHGILNVTKEVPNYFEVVEEEEAEEEEDDDDNAGASASTAAAAAADLDITNQVLPQMTEKDLLRQSFVNQERNLSENERQQSPQDEKDQSGITEVKILDRSDGQLDQDSEDIGLNEWSDEDDQTPVGPASLIFEYLRIGVEDSAHSNLLTHFCETNEFLFDMLVNQKKNVLVHCREGMSRSPSVVIAFLMGQLGWTLDKAFEHVLLCNGGKLRLNDGFKRQLMEFEREVHQKISRDFFESRKSSSRSGGTQTCGEKEKKSGSKKKVVDSSTVFQEQQQEPKQPSPTHKDAQELEKEVDQEIVELMLD